MTIPMPNFQNQDHQTKEGSVRQSLGNICNKKKAGMWIGMINLQ
jgi:hypothetical protein